MNLYRYTFVSDEHPTEGRLKLHTYPVIRESEASYWIQTNDWFPDRLKICRKNARKTFAYPTQKQALNNYIRRTKKYKTILEYNMLRATYGLIEAERLYTNLYTNA